MSKIAFFCIPAYGHTNPTVQVVRELTRRGHEVWYFSFTQFKEKIEGAGANFIPCDEYVADIGVTEEEGAKVALDLGVAIKTLTN
ncbi:MAG: glucosyltransferase, partial [Eubacteriales bacterium]|nr:glucosyltransferase [Eubacteriales bacterium]